MTHWKILHMITCTKSQTKIKGKTLPKIFEHSKLVNVHNKKTCVLSYFSVIEGSYYNKQHREWVWNKFKIKGQKAKGNIKYLGQN